MKVTIDLDKLLEEGKINQAEHDKFTRFSARGTTALAFNILVGFGVIGVSEASLALLPTPTTAIALGLVICAAGIALVYARYEQWMVLANIGVVVGALLFGGGVIKAGEGSVVSFLLVAAAFAGAGVFARSSLLTVFTVLALSSCLGARTGHFQATYFLGIQEPTLTVALFTIFSIATFQLSKRVAADYQGVAIAATRTGVFLVNFGFWIGSLLGDRKAGSEIVIADWIFSTLWAIALIAAGAWAWKQNRRWLVNVAAVFGAMHFYTQWFERLGASAQTVLIAALLALGFAIGLRALNVKLGKEA
jgi:iron complex transport system permease protein